MEIIEARLFTLRHYVVSVIVFIILLLTSMYSYLLFHSIVEIFSVVIASGIFMIAWNARNFLENDYLRLLGIAFLFIAITDTLHTLAYSGMGVFHGFDADLPTQLWITARIIQSLSILIAPIFIVRKLNIRTAILVYTAIVFLVYAIIFYFDLFPHCYVEGSGLTTFKIMVEIFISFVYIISIYVLYKKKDLLSSKVYELLIAAILISVVSELFFTIYIDVYGVANFLGHFLKLAAFFLIYKTIIETGCKEPYQLLFRNLKERNEKINQQKELLAEANRTKTKFFSIIAHDLKNPFNALLSSANYLIEEYDEMGKTEIKELAENIRFSANKLHNLLENLLQWSRAQSGSIEYKPEKNDLYYTAMNEISLITPSAVSKGVQLVIDFEQETYAYYDENMITTVIRNLLSNAIKFSRPGGVVRLDVKSKDDEIEFLVIDEGLGISKSNIKKLFRIDVKYSITGTKGEPGTGLGLLICKEFVERNKGKLIVESEEGKGSEFIFTLPLSQK